MVVTPAVMDKTLLLEQTQGGGDAALIIARGNPDRVSQYLHHRWKVRWTDVDVRIIIVGWHVGPALMGPSSPPDGMPARRRWF